ncbi:MAG: VIT1/CCC1 transporter family protein, partial [Candidatus Nanopelagicaceae bacterium]
MPIEDVQRRNEDHRTHRSGWLRAAVLGANDGLVSISALMIGVASAGANDVVFTAGMAGIAAGAMSMAVGEY